MHDNLDRINHWLGVKVPGASFDGDRTATIASGTDKHVVLEVSADSSICHFCAVVSPLDEADPLGSLLAALALNRFGKPLGGCWLAWEPDLEMLTLCWNLEIGHADELIFSNAIDNFLASLETARKELLVGAEPETDAQPSWLETA